MPKYRITAPDGHTYDITAPDGATQEEVLAYAQQNYKPKADFSNVRSRVLPGRATGSRQPFQRPQDMNAYERYLAGVGKSMRDTAAGFRQYAVDVAGDPSNALGPLGKPILRAIAGDQFDEVAQRSPALQRVRDYGTQLREDEAALRRTLPGMSEDPEFAFGNVVGTLSQIITPGVALRGTIAGRAALPATIGGNALQGGALGTIQPIAREGERGTNQALGATFGWLGAAAPKVLGAVARPVRSAISDLLGQPTASGVERRAAEQILAEAANPKTLTRAQPSAVPGVQRTLAEETLDPGVARLERQMRGSGPANVFTPIDQANAAARVRSIESIAGTDGDMAAAVAARQQASTSSRVAAMEAPPAQIAATLRSLDEAIAGTRGRTAVQPALQDLRNRLASYVDDGGKVDINTLDNVRQDIGDMLAGKFGGEKSAALAGSRELMGVRDALNNEVTSQVPAFGDYLGAYRAGSLPINRMEIGRELLEKGSASVATADNFGTGVRPLLPASFSKQANDLNALAARATRFDKARADQILTPEDIAKIRAVQDDLSRQSFRATAGSGGGSPTQPRQALARRLGRSSLRAVPGLGGIAESLEAMGEKRLNETLARLLANPEEARRVLGTLSPKDQSVLRKALFNLSARTGASVPALAE
jgi:hypothetical protein